MSPPAQWKVLLSDSPSRALRARKIPARRQKTERCTQTLDTSRSPCDFPLIAIMIAHLIPKAGRNQVAWVISMGGNAAI